MKKTNLLALLLIVVSFMTLAANTATTDANNFNGTVANSDFKSTALKDTTLKGSGCVQPPLIGVPIDVAVPLPSDLTAQLMDNQVILGWMSMADAHRIHYGTTSFAEVTEDNYAPWGLSHYRSKCVPKGKQTIIGNLINGTRYYFVVTAIHNNMQSPPSNEVSIMPPAFNS